MAQIRADLLGRPVETLADADTSAIGAAVLAAVAEGDAATVAEAAAGCSWQMSAASSRSRTATRTKPPITVPRALRSARADLQLTPTRARVRQSVNR